MDFDQGVLKFGTKLTEKFEINQQKPFGGVCASQD